MLVGGKHIELKNTVYTANTTPSQQVIEQVVGNKGAFGNISSLDDFEWVAFAPRNNETNLKTMWKKVFSNTDATKGPTTTDIFNTMKPELKQSLLGNNPATQSQIFNSLINDINSTLYTFIKAE